MFSFKIQWDLASYEVRIFKHDTKKSPAQDMVRQVKIVN